MTELLAPRRMVELEVDGQAVRVFEGATILDACTQLGIDTPTLCYGETLAAGQRLSRLRRRARGLARAGPRLLAQGRGRDEGADRLRARPAVAEGRAGAARLVGRPLDDARRARLPGAVRRRAGALRAARRAEPPTATARGPGITSSPTAAPRRPSHQPVKVDNELYVRDYAKCILCYKCVDACGEQYQNTFAIHVAGRGFDARISTELATPLPESACVYCGNCIAVCPTGALDVPLASTSSAPPATGARTSRPSPRPICPYCGVGCTLELHVQDNTIVKVTSPDDHDVTRGNLCIKGRFGFSHVQARRQPRRERRPQPRSAALDLAARHEHLGSVFGDDAEAPVGGDPGRDARHAARHDGTSAQRVAGLELRDEGPEPVTEPGVVAPLEGVEQRRRAARPGRARAR